MASFYQQFKICAHKYSKNNSILFYDSTKNICEITYNTLLDQINSISCILERNNVTRSECIGILIAPNPLLPAVILSVQKHECPFFCFDIFSLNIFNLIKTIGINYIFVHNATHSFENHATLICRENDLEFWKMNNSKNIIYNGVSYIIESSGTTGHNKLIKVLENCIMSNIESLRNILKINNTDVIYFGTPVTFDPFIVEIMLALTTGASLFIVDSKIKHNRAFLLEILLPTNKNVYTEITFLQMPPSVFLCFSEKEINKILCEKSNLRILALGGESFPKELFKYKNWSKNLKVYNLYGITEVSCWASVEEVSEFDQEVSLGKLLDETVFEIRDDFGNILQNGEGNLFIGSDKRVCLIDDENITKENIIFRDTGDIVRLDDKSNKIFYVGRKNNIIKRLGHKLNLSSIEKSVFDITSLTNICVWNKNTSKLILFIILQENDSIVKQKIIDRVRIKLIRCLTSISLPDIIQIIPSIPLTANGKTDRKCLLQIASLDNESTCNLPAEVIFQNLWSKYFGSSTHDINSRKLDSFLNLGGNSILAIQILSEFDSLVNNSYSGNLMELLLDPNKNYSDYLNLISGSTNSKLKRSFESEASKTKLQKVEIESNSENNFQIKIAWTFNLDACVDSSPAYIMHPRLGSLIAIGSHGQKFVLLTAKTGELISENILPDAVEGSACIIDEEIAVIGCNDGNIYFINIENGQIITKFSTKSLIKSTPVLCHENKRIMFGSYDKNLYCLNLQGTLEWKFETNESIKSNVVTNAKYVYAATINGSYYCISIKTGTLKWKNKSSTPIFSSPSLIENGNLIVWADVKGHVVCFECDNGDKLWTYEASGFIYSSLRNIHNKILFSCFDHNIYCLQCTRKECIEVFKTNIEGQSSTTPYIFNLNNNTYFLAFNNKGLLHLFDFENRILQKTFQLPAEVFSSPIVIKNKIFVGCRDNNVYCLELEIKTN